MQALLARDNRRLVERAVESLRERIVGGQFGCDGELPSQDDLCQQLAVSRTVVREALQQLQSQRLIVVSQGKRPRVRPVDSQAIAEGISLVMQRSTATLFDLAEGRLLLETEIAFKAAENAQPEHISRLATNIESMLAAESLEQRVAADIAFHSELAAASGNAIYRFLLDALAELLRESRRRTIGLGGVEPALAGHREILAAVLRHDRAAARDAMRRHLEASVQDLREASSDQETAT